MMLRIGYFSKLSGISIRMLRHYDEIALLTPESIDEVTGYRYYSEAQLPIANRIVALKNIGFSLTAAAEIIKIYDDSQALSQFLSVKRMEIQIEADEISRRLRLLDTAIKRLREDKTMIKYDVTVKTLPERTVASVRQIIPAYDREGILWGILNQETKDLKLQSDDCSYALAVLHDDGFKESDVDVEIQMVVKGNYKNTEHVVFKTEPAIEVASSIYKGSYEQLISVNEAVVAWMNDNGYEFDGTMFTIYHVGPHETQNSDEYVSEVCYSVKKNEAVTVI